MPIKLIRKAHIYMEVFVSYPEAYYDLRLMLCANMPP